MSVVIQNKESIVYESMLQFETIICYKCAIPFAVPTRYKQHLKDSQDSFYCPNGHSQSYTKSTETILREKIQRIERQKEQEENYLRSIISRKEELINSKSKEVKVLKSKHTKLKNRIANGVCPCCQRSFQNLHEHIKNQHPDYKTEE